jgi:hypothetical protein
MTPTTVEFHCYACDAAVSEHEILDGWCDACGKRLPASFQEAVRRRRKPAPAPAIIDLTDSPAARLARRIVIGVVALSVLVGLALLFALTGGR